MDASSLNTDVHWEYLQTLMNEEGILKLNYYKYRSILKDVRTKNIETGTLGFTPIGDGRHAHARKMSNANWCNYKIISGKNLT